MRMITAFLCSALLAACGGSCPSDFLAACSRERCADAVKKALEKDAALAKTVGPKGVTPLHVAATGAIAEALIAAGADIDAVSGLQQSPYGAAFENDRGDVVGVLLAKGVKISDRVYEARNAVRAGKPSVLAAYLDAGATPDDGMLLDAVINDQVAAAELLLAKGANAKAAMGAGMQMMSMGQTPQGVRSETSDVSGKNAKELARSDAMRELLQKHGG